MSKPSRSLLLLLCTLLLVTQSAFAQSNISGRIAGTDGIPLPGATVSIVGTNNHAVADSDGRFMLNAKPGDLLHFSFMGFQDLQVVLGNETELNISLPEATTVLDEVVVVGYGTSLRKDVSGSVASVSTDEFIQGNNTNPLQQIQAKVPGLVITQPGGDPNGDYNVRIRGATSLEGQPPLLVIDGVAIDDFNRAITTLNPLDIASYDVLKDAAAAAIYGSRGANGVILITTKKAKYGATTFEYSAYGSVETISNRFDVLNAQQWRDATAADPNASGHDLGANTDWQKEITRSAYTQSHIFSASGGSSQIRVRGSAGYINQQGIAINTGKEVLTARLSADIRSANDKLNIAYGINTSIINRNFLPDQTSTAQVRQGGAYVFSYTPSYLPVWPVHNSSGSYYQPSGPPNPVFLLEELYSKQKQNFFQTSVKADYELIDGLKVGALAALSNGNDTYDRFWPPRINSTDEPSAGKSNANKQNFTGDLHFNFKKEFGDHSFDLTGVYEYNKFVNDGFSVNARGPVVEGLLLTNNLGTATSVSPGDISSYKNEVRIISFLGRLVYNYQDRFILTGTFRRDGSSKFGPNNRWGNFPSAAIAWRISNENFMSGNRWLDLKLRASYGLTGNQENLPPYNYQTLYGPSGPYYINGSYGQSYGVVQEGNPDLKWEVRESLNFGMDFSLWDDRVNGMLDVFSDKTSDMLFLYNIPQPPFVTNQAYANAANATNKGVELSLGGYVITNDQFRWNIRGNIGAVRNRITNVLGEFKGFDLSVTNSHYGYATGGSFQYLNVTEIKEGYPAGVFWLPQHAGFDEKGNELFVTYDGEGKVTGTDVTFTDKDRQYINPTPDFEWGLTNTFSYRNFDLSIFIRGVQGSKVFANSLLNLGSTAYLPASNVTERALTDGFVNKPNISTFWLEDGSFARLENLTLGYTLGRIKGITKLRIYAVGRNLFLLTKYGGVDPEVNVEGPQRYIDFSYYPKTRSFTIGLDISF
ncbi:MAG TPA: SusC/RagA family TonB-linked outer membrane protein [Chryseolinea sp.]|nr:SusC/RagA family TonB-linked outer membrane protein [Chryseolinea sp.]